MHSVPFPAPQRPLPCRDSPLERLALHVVVANELDDLFLRFTAISVTKRLPE